MKTIKRRGRAATRTNDPERTKANIIQIATEEFAEVGYSGARIDRIADKMNTSKRMIYYYFGSKEELYRAVLFEHYRRLRANDRGAALQEKSPMEALATLTRLTFDWYVDHASEVPLVMVENTHRGKHISSLPEFESLNSTAIELVRSIYESGVAAGVMRPGLRPIDIYITIASASFFNVSNRYTFKAIFGHDMSLKDEIERRREALTDTVLRYVAA